VTSVRLLAIIQWHGAHFLTIPIIPLTLHTHPSVYHRCCIFLATDSVVQQYRHYQNRTAAQDPHLIPMISQTIHFISLNITCVIHCMIYLLCGSGSSVGIATELRAGRSGDRIPVGARFSAPVLIGPGAHPASCTMGTGSFPGVESGRSVTLTPHPLLVPRYKNRVELYIYSP
jgi:hypothetical protein